MIKRIALRGLPQVPKSFREFAMDCKAAQRDVIRQKRESLEDGAPLS